MLSIMIWSPLASVVSTLGMGIFGAVTLGFFYYRGTLIREFGEVRHGRKLAATKVRKTARYVSDTKKQALKIEHDAKKLSSQQARKRKSVQASYDRRLRGAVHPQESIDRQLKRLDDRKQRERNRRLRAAT